MVNGEITKLNDTRKNKINLFTHTKEVIDKETGEVVSSIHSFVKQAKTRDEFVKLYIENIDFLQTLTGAEMKILFYAIKNLTYSNSFTFSRNFISYFLENNILKTSTIYKNFNTLLAKKVFLKPTDDIKREMGLYGDDIYFVNPEVVGRGSFLSLEKLKRTITQTFDFKTLTVNQEITTESQYDGFQELVDNQEKHEVESISQNISEDGKKVETEIVVGKKDENLSQISISKAEIIDIEPKNEDVDLNNIDIEKLEKQFAYTGEHIKELELQRQTLELETEKLRLEIKKLELQERLNGKI